MQDAPSRSSSSSPSGWRVIKSGTTAADGGFAFQSRLRRSGQLRVALGDESAVRSSATPVATTAARSASQRVTVAAALPVPYRRLDVPAGGTAVVRGRLRPWRAGRTVRLEILAGRRWRVVDRDRTDVGGRYALAYKPASSGSRFARVTFAGDAANGAALRRVGTVSSYRPALASRYDMYGGALACGGSLGYNAWSSRTRRCRVARRCASAIAGVRSRPLFVTGGLMRGDASSTSRGRWLGVLGSMALGLFGSRVRWCSPPEGRGRSGTGGQLQRLDSATAFSVSAVVLSFLAPGCRTPRPSGGVGCRRFGA